MTFPTFGTVEEPPMAEADLLPRPWIVETSRERIGQPWRAEDHVALLQHLQAVDQLVLAWFEQFGPARSPRPSDTDAPLAHRAQTEG